MNDRFLFSLLAVATITALSPTLSAQQGSARYELTFQSTWSAGTHPTQFPGNPHYSPLVGGTHNSNAVFWAPGQTASNGIEQMAETGGTSLLVNEVNQQLNAGNANQVLNFGGSGALGNSPGQLTVSFTAQPDFSELSLVTMLAPSPDWFLGVHGFNLMENGDWIESAVIPLHVYDAGTDSGTTYTSGNANTSPRAPIQIVTTASGPFQGAPTMVGTFTIQRVSSTLVYGCNNPAGSLSINGNAELGQTLQFALMEPTGQLPTPAVSALALAATRDINFPCGTLLPGFGLASGSAGEVLLGSIDALATGPTFLGGSAIMFVTLPNQASLLGQEFYFQGLLASTRVGLTRGVAIRIGN
tara:strand:+ start:44194 stop:45264 length:1071 start_codon:yes stop_codon:yes gene_type:complete